ncbi:MAG: lipopolysaccharide biosynthesis protein [Methylococcaceae bacterium]|nr:lipopolysaccharide biosynthesis protein [Methylococcaceae bacterium]
MKPDSPDINKQSVSAVKWSALGSVAQYGLSLGAQIVLARLLGPENYGLFAMGTIVLTFSNFFSNFGFAWGLIQIQHLVEEDIRFVFTWQLITGSLVAVGLYLLAPLVAQYFNEPRIDAIVRWLSLACVFSSLTAPASNLLRRNLDFRWINIIQIISYSVGYLGIGLPLAYHGAGVWSLVAAWLAQAFVMMVMTFIRQPHSLKPLFWYSGAKAISGVGITVFVTNLCNWLLNNMDRIFLGRYLDSHAVGLYTVGYNLANTPNSLLIGALQPAFLTAGARLQSEPERLRRAYLPIIASVWILMAPLFALFAIIAPYLIGFLYGSAWESSALVLTILALSMPAYITWSMSTPILWNTNRKHFESLLQLPILALAGYAFYNYGNQGIVMVALIAAGLLFIRSVAITTAACHQLNISILDLWPLAIRGIAMMSLAVIGTLGGIKLGTIASLYIGTKLNATVTTFAGININFSAATTYLMPLLGGCFSGGSILLVTALIFPKLLGAEVIGMLSRFSPRLAQSLDNNAKFGSKNK